MIYTGYFAKIKNYDGECFSIARYTPKNIRCGYAPMFFPSEQLLFDWKIGTITEEEYVKRYHEETLNKINVPALLGVLQQYQKDIFFLCYEKPNDFCHRHLVAEWLNNLGIVCRESEK